MIKPWHVVTVVLVLVVVTALALCTVAVVRALRRR